MMKQRHISIFLIALMGSLLISGCKEKPSTPEQAALDFFAAIYIDDDVDKATQHTLPKLTELLQHYKTAHAVKRHLIGLSMQDVELNLSDTDADFFRKVATKAQVTIRFKGKIDGRVREDERTVKVIKKGNIWYVDSIKADIFMSNG
jgi:phage tail tube protein FII